MKPNSEQSIFELEQAESKALFPDRVITNPQDQTWPQARALELLELAVMRQRVTMDIDPSVFPDAARRNHARELREAKLAVLNRLIGQVKPFAEVEVVSSSAAMVDEAQAFLGEL